MNVAVGETVLMDIRSGVDPVTHTLRVVSTTPRRFVAEGSIHGSRVRLTFRKADGRSVGSKCYSYARRELATCADCGGSGVAQPDWDACPSCQGTGRTT